MIWSIVNLQYCQMHASSSGKESQSIYYSRSFLFRVCEGELNVTLFTSDYFPTCLSISGVDSATTHHFRRCWMKWTIMPANESLLLKTWWPASVSNLPNTFRIWNRSAKQWERGAGKGGVRFGIFQIDVAQRIILKLFFPQHLSDAKKAQQNLESSFKHLESVSHRLLLVDV